MWFLIPIGFLVAGVFWPKKAGAAESQSIMEKVFGPWLSYGPPTQSSIDGPAYTEAKAHIIEVEGRRNDVYKDSKGILTVGIGHKVLPSDGLVYGQKITDAQVDAFFSTDVSKAFAAARSQAKELGKYTVEMIAALTSVNFQLGTGWKNDFANTWKYLKSGNEQQAIANLKMSKWYQQTPQRVSFFIATIQNEFA